MKKLRFILCLVILTLVMMNCKEKYYAQYNYPDKGFLVVEGFINSAGPTNINLSRTVKLADAVSIKFETGAIVRVEGDDNSSYNVPALGNGLYSTGQLPINDSRKYRLYIKTSNGKEYRSDFAAVIRTPPIDSISYPRTESGGVDITINTHDPKNKTWYYTWSYEQTWQHTSLWKPTLKFISTQNGLSVTYIYPDQSSDTTRFRCWGTENSTNVLIGSSKKLSRDEIHLPLASIEKGSIKISELFSIKIYQHGVSEAGYDFLQRMKKNTQQVGSIFDAQPSQLNGNIHNTLDPLEEVVGFIDVADGYDKRIYIEPKDVPGWGYLRYCDSKEVVNSKDSLSAGTALGLGPIEPVVRGPGNAILTLTMGTNICIDCTLLGGTTIKPSFWPR